MKTLFTFCISLLTVWGYSQVPTNFGSDAEDGVTYQNYNLINHGSVSSVRFMAQNAVAEGVAKWEFYTGDYSDNWRPYTADDTLSSFNVMIDPSLETASARYNSNYGGGTGRMPEVQAGSYYTAIIGNNAVSDNFMSIVETYFNPVAIDTVYHTPENPTEADDISYHIRLDGVTELEFSPDQRVFIRATSDGWATSFFGEYQASTFNPADGTSLLITNAGQYPAGTTIEYYVLVTKEEFPVHETIDYHTLYFANNGGDNYQFTISSLTGVEDPKYTYGLTQSNGSITLNKCGNLQSVELVSLDGRVVGTTPVNGGVETLSTTGLTKGIYILNLIATDKTQSVKLFVD
jgi:hypothetical protein